MLRKCIAAVLISYSCAHADIGEKIDRAISSGASFELKYVGEEWNSIVQSINENMSSAIPELKDYIANAPSIAERMVALNLFEQSNANLSDAVHYLFPGIDYSNLDEYESATAIARRLMPATVDGPDYSFYAAYLARNSDAAQIEAIVKWLLADSVFYSIDGIGVRLLAERGRFEEYRTLILGFREIQESAWREQRDFIPDNTMTDAATEALDTFLQSPDWWVRLAVVELLHDYPYMATQSRKGFVREETSSVVRERAKQLGVIE